MLCPLILEVFAETKGLLSAGVARPYNDAYFVQHDAVFEEGINGDGADLDKWFGRPNDTRNDRCLNFFVGDLIDNDVAGCMRRFNRRPEHRDILLAKFTTTITITKATAKTSFTPR